MFTNIGKYIEREFSFSNDTSYKLDHNILSIYLYMCVYMYMLIYIYIYK